MMKMQNHSTHAPDRRTHPNELVRLTAEIDYWQAKHNQVERDIAHLRSVSANRRDIQDCLYIKTYIRKRLTKCQFEQAELLSKSADLIAQSCTLPVDNFHHSANDDYYFDTYEGVRGDA